MKIPVLIAPAALLAISSLLTAQSNSSGPQRCEALAKLDLPNVTVTTAKAEAAGEFAGPRHPFTGADISAFYKQLPAFCRVVAKAHPSSDSDIAIEVWLPLDNWNGKLQGLANGGFAGAINYLELGASLQHGYVATGTDTGHTGSPIDAAWALGHPEKIIDFGYRGIHEMTRVAKLVISQFYGSAPKRSYFAGCSDGGREALMEAQRFPTDYDGILAGAPANAWSTMVGAGVIAAQARQSDPRAYFSDLKLPAVQKASLAACDALDGVKDGIVNDPSKCHFDAAVLLCKTEETLDCLTQPQIDPLKSLYVGQRDRSGKVVFPGFTPGDEMGWREWVIGQDPTSASGLHYVENYFRYMVTGDPKWNPLTADPEASLRESREKEAADLDATNTDLSKFSSRGGKLILYHGWNDQAIPPWNTVDYYKSVQQKMGGAQTASFLRLYMAPGVEHCAGGPGPSFFGQFGTQTAKGSTYGVFDSLVNWVEKGAPEENITATKYGQGENGAPKVVMTRPLCAYPKVVKYSGTGDTNDAANFTCAAE